MTALSRCARHNAALLLAAGLPAAAFAQLARLDDSTSPRAVVQSVQVLDEHGRPLEHIDPARPARFGIVRFGPVEYRLATAPYVGKRARIWFVVPAGVPGLRNPAGMRLEWRSGGLFAAGMARGGERALVWEGRVQQPVMSERLDLTLEVRLAELVLRGTGALSFESHFEIEVVP